MNNVRPLHDWAVIRPSEAESISSGGLYIPDSAKEKPREGIVVAIGPGAYEEEKFGKKKSEQKERKFIPTTIKPGDRVLYEKYADKSYTIGKEEMVLVRERDILGTLPQQKTASPRPLQIPANTTAAGSVALVKSESGQRKDLTMHKPAERNAATPTRKKTVKKAAKKAVKKAAKKTVKKSRKKTAKKTPKKAAKKSAAQKKAVARKASKKTKR